MQTPLALYIATVLGGLGLSLMMPRERGRLPILGALLGGAALGGLWLLLAGGIVGESVFDHLTGLSPAAFTYYYLFSAIAIVSGVRVITHTRPVYSALWFVMVVLSSAGLLLVLAAEFMAFAMVIIYAGAILVTYVFVIMLASQSQSPDAPADADSGGASSAAAGSESEVSPVYDRLAREPFSAVVAGFLLLAVLLTVAFPPEPMSPVAAAQGATDTELAQDVLADRPERPTLAEQVETDTEGELAGQEQLESAVGQDVRVSNGERIGVDLFRSHPLGLELAGVILLVSLIGAVVIAKTHVPEEREATG